jgi:hypothetical protein
VGNLCNPYVEEMYVTASKFYRALLLTAVSSLSLSCVAQGGPARSTAPPESKFELSVDYGYLHPVASDIYNQQYPPLPGGAVAGATAYFSRTFGLTTEYGKFPDNPDYCYSSIQGGPVFRHQMGRLVPFVHLLGGGVQLGPSYSHSGASNPCIWGWGGAGGLGIDYVLPAWNHRIAIRPIEGDLQYAYANFGPQPATNVVAGGVARITAYRLSAGLVFRFGEMSQAQPAAFGCEAQPVSVYPGDPVNVTGRAINLEQSRKLLPAYTWSVSGGRITGGAGGATVATSGLAPGDYTVVGKVSEGSQPSQHAECTASFRVIAYEPPTVACVATPASLMPGGLATITTTARSPQNRPLTYSYSASTGHITGTSTTATLATDEVAPGPITVTCNVRDDAGNSASGKTTVTVSAPPAPRIATPTARSLCSISFDRDKKHPTLVDSEAKQCLDDVALELYRNPDSVLVVIGRHDPQEKPDVAVERAQNVKRYLTEIMGIDPTRIQLRIGESTGRTADHLLVPGRLMGGRQP